MTAILLAKLLKISDIRKKNVHFAREMPRNVVFFCIFSIALGILRAEWVRSTGVKRTSD